MNPRSQVREKTLGTFGGVFTPSVLTILGIILFLRLGYVVGNAGLGRALIIVGLANAISVLTSISLSAIATNLRVKGGGDYYLISRTLGPQFGGAIGIVLFLAQSVSIAFYCIGFGEAVDFMLPQTARLSPQIIAVLAVSFLFVFAWLGADWATKFQYVVMSILAAALVSFFAGGLTQWDVGVAAQNWTVPSDRPAFWVLFAIFFPAVTGFTQGVSMSGDLRDPGRSLPLGTFLAVGVSILVYFAVAIVFAGTLPGDLLRSDYSAMKKVAWFGLLIDAGVIAATLSSAMASFLGAPRILQSLAGDRIFPFLLPFAQGAGPAENPRRAVLLSTVIAFATIGLGKLNLIAPVVSMFFLISYGLLNYATFFEARASSPSFRPRFRWFDYRLSLVGFLACLGTMLAIDLRAGAIAIAVLFAIYQYLERTAGPARWADSRRSYHLKHIREHLLAAAAEPEHPRDWRPNLLVFSNDPHRRGQLLRFASWLQGQSGLTTAVRIVEGEGIKALKLRREAEEELRQDIAGHGVAAFPLILAVPSPQEGVHALVQSFGIGPVKANTILLNWFEQLPKGVLAFRELRYGSNLRAAFRLGCNVIVLDAKEEEWTDLKDMPPEKRRIDVWWWGDATGRLMLLLAYLTTTSHEWEGTKIRVLCAGYEAETGKTIEGIREMLEEARIDAQPEIVATATAEAIVAYSEDAAMVFLPLRLRGNQVVDPFGDSIEELLLGLPIVALVLAAKDVELDAEPEDGKAGEVAAARDALSEARKKATEAEKEAHKAAKIAEAMLTELKTAEESGLEEKEAVSKLKSAFREAEEEAAKASRRAARFLAKMEAAERDVGALETRMAEGDTRKMPTCVESSEESDKKSGSP